MESRFLALLGVVLAATLLPSAFAACGVDSKSGKFQAPQLNIAPGTYQWQLSPCKAETFAPCSSKNYIVQFTSDGQCDTNNLICNQEPKETKTSTGYQLNFFCGSNINGEKDAQVNVKCTKGPLTLVGQGVSVSNPDPNFAKKYLYTFNMEGGCGGFDGGWIFVIIVLVGLFLYFVGGFAFNFFVRKLRGIEAIPNVTFWKDLPYLVKDGFMFVFGRFCGRGGFSTVK